MWIINGVDFFFPTVSQLAFVTALGSGVFSTQKLQVCNLTRRWKRALFPSDTKCRNRVEWLRSIRTFVLFGFLFVFFYFQVFRWTICIYILFCMSSCGSFLNCACSFLTTPVACSLWVDIGWVPMGCVQPHGWWVWRGEGEEDENLGVRSSWGAEPMLSRAQEASAW